MSKILIIAGPNGAGKTTFAKTFLPAEAECMRFLNADLIAAGLAPFSPETAAIKSARLMLEEMAISIRKMEDFSFETTLSGLAYKNHIKKWRKMGYHVSLFFLSLNSPDLAVDRVAQRVKQGGHNIPEEIIRRRFSVGLYNFEHHYCSIVDTWALYDNSIGKPNLLKWGENK
jgi:predicted ABC-type ATPase